MTTIESQVQDSQSGAKTPVVRLHEVGKTYLSGEINVTALKGISLAIPVDRFSVVVGASGSGKTTLLNLIGCIDAPSSGTVEVCEQSIAKLDDNAVSDFRARNIGFIFQSFSLVPVLSAYENIEYPLLLVGIPAAQRQQRTLAMLDPLGLSGRARHRPTQLSGGQRRPGANARPLAQGR